MNNDRNSMLAEMGLGPIWQLRARKSEPVAEAQPSPMKPAPATAVSKAAPPASPLDDRAAAIAHMDWDTLAKSVAECRACPLCEARKQAVLGVGDKQAQWLFVGEGPGAEEDEKGEPFVGQAGKLLDAMLAAINLKRGQDVYIANAVKCRPPENRTPAPTEIAACRPYLLRQIALLRPKLIVAMGRPAAQTLLTPEGDIKISASRLRTHDHQGIPVVVTYHPAYLLRNLPDKARAWEDLCFAKTTMNNSGNV